MGGMVTTLYSGQPSTMVPAGGHGKLTSFIFEFRYFETIEFEL